MPKAKCRQQSEAVGHYEAGLPPESSFQKEMDDAYFDFRLEPNDYLTKEFDDYMAHINDRLADEWLPDPPESGIQMQVLCYMFPELVHHYQPLLLFNTRYRRALLEFLHECNTDLPESKAAGWMKPPRRRPGAAKHKEAHRQIRQTGKVGDNG